MWLWYMEDVREGGKEWGGVARVWKRDEAVMSFYIFPTSII